MKRSLIGLALLALLTGCAATSLSEGEQATQAMTDADGRPIDPGRSGTLGSGARFGIGIGAGSWGGHSGGGVGVGLGF